MQTLLKSFLDVTNTGFAISKLDPLGVVIITYFLRLYIVTRLISVAFGRKQSLVDLMSEF